MSLGDAVLLSCAAAPGYPVTCKSERLPVHLSSAAKATGYVIGLCTLGSTSGSINIDPAEVCHCFLHECCVSVRFSSNNLRNRVRNPSGGPSLMRSLIAVVKPIDRSCFSDCTRDKAM